MSPLPFVDPGARIAFFIVLGVFVVLEQRIRLRSWLDHGGSREDHGSLAVVILFVGAGLAGGFALAAHVHSAAITGARWPLFILGVALMGLGIAIRQWAIVLLGRFFTVDVRVRSGQAVVDRGPYRWVRHPSYTGMIIIFIGIGLALGNWASLAVLAVVPTVGLVLRIHAEERALIAGLGESYRRFAAGRARLLPGIW